MEKIFFDSWESILRTMLISVLAYVSLVAMLRIVGNRPLTQINAFDFIVNVAIGSTLATVMLNKDVGHARSNQTAECSLLNNNKHETRCSSNHSR